MTVSLKHFLHLQESRIKPRLVIKVPRSIVMGLFPGKRKRNLLETGWLMVYGDGD